MLKKTRTESKSAPTCMLVVTATLCNTACTKLWTNYLLDNHNTRQYRNKSIGIPLKSKTNRAFGDCQHSAATFITISIVKYQAHQKCLELLKYLCLSPTLLSAQRNSELYTSGKLYFMQLQQISPYPHVIVLINHSYKIHSNTSRAGFESGAHSVVRRYSDFTWLSGELSKEFPGVIVPPLPEKLTVGRFGDEFVDSRRRGLEKFLQRIASHSELSNSQYFIVFLQAAESGLTEAKNESKSGSKAKSTSSIGWLEGTVNNLTTGAKVCLDYYSFW